MKISHALAALLGTLLMTVPTLAQADLELDARDPERPARAALFRAPGFPTADALEIDGAVLGAGIATAVHAPVRRQPDDAAMRRRVGPDQFGEDPDLARRAIVDHRSVEPRDDGLCRVQTC